jgi:hypothetical protein
MLQRNCLAYHKRCPLHVSNQGTNGMFASFLTSRKTSKAGLALCFPPVGSVTKPLAKEKVVTEFVAWLRNEGLLLTTPLLPCLQPDLCFLLVSGRTGSPVGRPVKYNIVGVGNLIGPQAYITASGAVYILFGFGKKQGWISLLFLWYRWQGISCETGENAQGSLTPVLSVLPITGVSHPPLLMARH